MQENVETDEEKIEIYGAREHNLKNISLSIPRNKLVVITGMSGSGKSSLAFDTIYAEGQRRYIETFSAYARQFLGGSERPDVDKITGLSPVISIEQKTTNKNPRSTVGTVTELYDFFRLLYARAGEARSYNTGELMVKQTDEQILKQISEKFEGKRIYLLAPMVKGRKGHYKELFEQIRKRGYLYARIDGEIREVTNGMKLDRYKIHFIELMVDKLCVDNNDIKRLKQSIDLSLQVGKGIMMVTEADSNEVRYFSRNLMCPTTGISYADPAPHNFSFNSPQGACPRCKGLGRLMQVDKDKIFPNPEKSINEGGIDPVGKKRGSLIFAQLEAIVEKFDATLDTPIGELSDECIDTILYGSPERLTLRNASGLPGNYYPTYDGIANYITTIQDEATSAKERKWAGQFAKEIDCPECNGQRLNLEARHFFIDGKNISEVADMDMKELKRWLDGIEDRLSERQRAIAGEILKEIRSRLGFLLDVGLDYLSMNRGAVSLSGGESQRIRLATQIGSQLVNVLYILDEPSIGLHQRDNIKLIDSLKQLRDNGNSVIVVEHDRDMMMEADHVIDVGPGAGRFGGNIVAQGTPAEIMKTDTLTAQYLNNQKRIEVPKSRRKGNGHKLTLRGCKGNNLKNISVDFPLGTLICLTGVSASGKSTLIYLTPTPTLKQHLYHAVKVPLVYDTIEGLEFVDKVVDVDQTPLGRTPRSNPATYTGLFDDIRKIFTELPESKLRNYKAGRFSFNVSGGRCETCKGAGVQVIEMSLLPDVMVECPACRGKRYNRETLEVRFKGKSIGDILQMTINVAVEFFENIPGIAHKLRTLQSVGMGYVKLGQPSKRSRAVKVSELSSPPN